MRIQWQSPVPTEQLASRCAQKHCHSSLITRELLSIQALSFHILPPWDKHVDREEKAVALYLHVHDRRAHTI